jgi:hypothetical protein
VKKSIIRKVFLVLGLALLLFLTVLDAESFALSVGTSSSANLSVAVQQALSKKQDISNRYERTETIGVYSLFLPFLASLEYSNHYFKKCGVVTNPPVLNNFLKSSVNTRYGLDEYALDYIQKAGQIGLKNKMLNQRKIKNYVMCVASYGLIISQAFKTFSHSLNNYGSAIANQVYKVPNNAFYNEIGSSLVDAMQHQDRRLKATYNDIKKDVKTHTCVLIDRNIKCGGVFLNFFSGTSTLSFGGIEWFDPSKDFAGRNDIITLGYSNSTSNERSLDKHRAVNWTADNAANINSDLFHSLF